MRRWLARRPPVRGRTWLFALLAVVALLVMIQASGWTLVAREPLPVTTYSPTRSADPTTAQTLADATFEAGGGAFAWEVVGFPQMTSAGIHAYQYRVHRVGGEPARIWPDVALLLDARGDNVGDAALAPPAVEDDVLVIRYAFAPPRAGPYELTAALQLEVVRDLAFGYRTEEPVVLRLPLRVERAR